MSFAIALSDEQWELVEPFLPDAKTGGRPRKTDLREVLNALFYLVRSGCQWRMLPHDLPPWRIVYYYYARWREAGLWQRLRRQGQFRRLRPNQQ